MIKRYNTLSFQFFIPGFIIQILGLAMRRNLPPELAPLSLIVLLIGGALCITGLVFYAKAKGRSPAFAVCGFFGIFGLIVLAVLKDMSGDPWNTKPPRT